MATEGVPNPSREGGAELIQVDGTGFNRVGRREGLWTYLKRVWDFRHFVIFDSKSRIAGESSDDNLGRLWMVLNPILNGAAYFLVFGILLGTSRGIENFIAYLIIGVFMYRFTASTIVAGSKAISGNRALVTAFNFPRMTLPLAINVREMMRNVTTYVTMFALILLIPPLEPITWKWLVFIPIVALQFLFNLGLSLVLARIVADWNDFTHILTFGTRIWMYLSAVFYSVDRFADLPLILALMNANPLFNVLDMSRDVLLYDTWPDPMRWLILGGWTVGLLIIGTLMFWQGEEKYGRER
ncbi:ABC transporter permease [Enteractinococcus coprophilus]|uniref:Transport permease protein n=1 Tax=Enteractinococcus coprophilus TaxID=1027633 RepID=A0A543AIN2_9MICC|nr:ABC transporter permease [Enteractinococcus coprophilus]TQL72425.1 teichoic acid transport system permease protein [Enteractinococcus coprophilus]